MGAPNFCTNFCKIYCDKGKFGNGKLAGSGIIILKHKQLIWRAAQNLAQRLDIFVSDGRGLVVHHLVEVLIAHALEASVGLENAQLQILHGLSLFYLANSEDEFCKVLQELKILETNNWYPNDADHYDDVIFTTAALTLAMLYREGISGKADLQHAHQALLSVYNAVKSADQKAKLSSELSHYRMSKFGGFTYS